MLNVRRSQGVELRRALRNQEVDLLMQHLKEKQGLVDESVLITRDEALAELQQLKLGYRQLQAYVSNYHPLLLWSYLAMPLDVAPDFMHLAIPRVLQRGKGNCQNCFLCPM